MQTFFTVFVCFLAFGKLTMKTKGTLNRHRTSLVWFRVFDEWPLPAMFQWYALRYKLATIWGITLNNRKLENDLIINAAIMTQYNWKLLNNDAESFLSLKQTTPCIHIAFYVRALWGQIMICYVSCTNTIDLTCCRQKVPTIISLIILLMLLWTNHPPMTDVRKCFICCIRALRLHHQDSVGRVSQVQASDQQQTCSQPRRGVQLTGVACR